MEAGALTPLPRRHLLLQRLAYLLEVKTGKKMEEILTVKKKTPKWKEWAEINLGVKPEDFSQWILETRNPALKPK